MQNHRRDKQQQQVHRKEGTKETSTATSAQKTIKEGNINILGSNIKIEVNNNNNNTGWKEAGKFSHTWVSDGDDPSPAEVAVPVVPPRLLVISIERIRGMR